MSITPVMSTNTSAGRLSWSRFFCSWRVNERVPRKRMVEMPAPTAASVNATSTASMTTKAAAATRL